VTTFDPAEAGLDTTEDDASVAPVAPVTAGTIVAGTGFVVEVFGVGAASGVDALFPREPFLKVPTVPEEDPAFPPEVPPPLDSELVPEVDPEVEVEVEPVLEPELGVDPEPPRVLLPVAPPAVVPPEPELVLPEPPELEEPAEPATATNVPAAPTAPPDNVPFTATT